MDKQWYYEDHGRAKGPISTGDLVAKIQKGELKRVDLVFQDGAGEWQPIENFKELTSQLSTTSAGSTPREAEWIILRVVEVDGKERYEQIGPYNVEQVLELIDAGRVKFNDFVWKTGFETWVPLGKLDKFDKPLASSVEVDQSLYKKPKYYDEAAAKQAPVKAYTPVQKIPELKNEAPPEGASGPDLALPKWATDLRESLKAPEKSVAGKEVVKEPTKTQKIEIPKEATKTQKKEMPREEEARRADSGPSRDAEKSAEKSPAKEDSVVKKVTKELFDFGQSVTNLLSPLKGPKKAPTSPYKPEEPAKKDGAPIKIEAVDLGERTNVYRREPEAQEVAEKIPVRKPQRAEEVAAKPETAAETRPETRSGVIPQLGKIVKTDTVSKIVKSEPPKPAPNVIKNENTTTSVPPVVVTKVVKKEMRPQPQSEMITPTPPPERDPEALEKMQSRWNKVGVAAAVIFVVAGVGLFSFWSKKRGDGDIAAKIAFEKHGSSTPSLSQYEGGEPAPEPEVTASEPAPEPVKPEPTVETAPPPQETAKSALPAPSMDIPPEAVEFKKKKDAKGEAVAKADQSKSKEKGKSKGNDKDDDKNAAPEDVSKMSFKQKSFYHQQERMAIFYNSQKGLNLANLLDAAIKKKNKSPATWKKFQTVWQGNVKSLNSKIGKDLPSPKVHTTLAKSLKTAVANLDKRGKEIGAQMMSPRRPTKDPSVSDIIAEFKKINAKAKSLDQ